jgi:hypothetical protein
MEESAGSFYALMVAYDHLEKYASFRPMVASFRPMVEQLKSENDELKDRLKVGYKEYTKLLEKYRLVKNQQFNHDMNAYHDLNDKTDDDLQYEQTQYAIKKFQSKLRHRSSSSDGESSSSSSSLLSSSSSNSDHNNNDSQMATSENIESFMKNKKYNRKSKNYLLN